MTFVNEVLSSSDLSARQEEILDGLEQIFVVEGFRRLTLAELAKRLCCSLRSLYRIAPTKEELFLRVLDRMWNRLGAAARSVVVEHSDALSRVQAYVRDGQAIFHASDVFFSDIRAYGPARQLFQSHLELKTDFLAQLIAEGVDSGHLRTASPRLVARAIGALALQTNDEDFRAGLGMDKPAADQELLNVLIHGLRA
jgi:AcrR family transcriptional regulator